MPHSHNRGDTAGQAERRRKRNPVKHRLSCRRDKKRRQAAAGPQEDAHDYLPSPAEARACVADLQHVLGLPLLRQLLRAQVPNQLARWERGRHLVGWLWLIVVRRPRDLRHMATFGRFMKPGDGHPIHGLEDWSI